LKKGKAKKLELSAYLALFKQHFLHLAKKGKAKKLELSGKAKKLGLFSIRYYSLSKLLHKLLNN